MSENGFFIVNEQGEDITSEILRLAVGRYFGVCYLLHTTPTNDGLKTYMETKGWSVTSARVILGRDEWDAEVVAKLRLDSMKFVADLVEEANGKISTKR